MNKNSNSLTFDNSESIMLETKIKSKLHRNNQVKKQLSSSTINIKNTTNLKPPLSKTESKAG